APDLLDALEVDVVGVGGPRTLFGFENKDWKPWQLFDGTPVLVPGAFNTDPEPNGDVLMYPEGDKTVPPSGRMPKDGFYFDAIVRQDPIDEDKLRVEDNLEEFQPISDHDVEWFRTEAGRQHQTGRAILLNPGGTAFGDIALVPAMWRKRTRGIRDIAEWYMSTTMRRDHVYKIFERQCEIALENWEKVRQAVGNKVAAVFVTGTDFGTQHGPFISPDAYRDLYKPFHKTVNEWIHKNTTWKSFIHSCGSVRVYLDDFVDAGFDILNPVQCSAKDMGAAGLKERYGDRLVFWGGGVDTQKTLPFGSPDEVRNEVRERIEIFGKDGGFIFNTIHNVQAAVPTENLLALYDALQRLP
ncbi:MAG: methyltransferase, partial [Candidatus Hydrogenedentes bacterium]|nr:methyltransferase [Candidatus Hydrogenedentota bacterium]